MVLDIITGVARAARAVIEEFSKSPHGQTVTYVHHPGGFERVHPSNGPIMVPADPWTPPVPPVTVALAFAPGDEHAGDYLLPDQPVLLIVGDGDPASPLEDIVAMTTLDEPLVASLYPGTYAAAAFVFLNDDFDEDCDNRFDGVGLAQFSVEPFEDDFIVPISTLAPDEDEICELWDALMN